MGENLKTRKRIRIAAALALSVLLVLAPAVVRGQTSRAKIGGLSPTVPTTVPVSPPRPSQGSAPGEQWLPPSEQPPRAPVAGFVESLSGSDAAMELVIGQGRVLTLRQPIESEEGVAMIALGNPIVADFTVMPNPRMLRLRGISPGVTDMTITTADGENYVFEIHVVYDLRLLHAQLRQVFPDAMIKVSQIREHLVVEGQVRSTQQAKQVMQTLQAYQFSVLPPEMSGSTSQEDDSQLPAGRGSNNGNYGRSNGQSQPESQDASNGLATERRPEQSEASDQLAPQIINLLRVPGVQQVMLQVKIAELDRTALREIGADMFYSGTDGSFGTQISSAVSSLAGLVPGAGTTTFAIFPNAQFDFMLRALRQNSILSILAEPNLVAMNGENASFLAGGEFPVPVPQQGGGGGNNTITIEYKEFGTQLNFLPTIMDDESIRLKVAPEVSTIDEAIAVEFSGFNVPGLQTRKLQTVVELKEGETLALAGLLQTEMNAQTARIPLVGDLPYVGPLFSNTSHKRVERELLVLVTPKLVRPMKREQLAPAPGEEINDPNDLEFYLLNRLEGRTGRPHRPTTNWDDPCGLVELMKLESSGVCGPVGLSECPTAR